MSQQPTSNQNGFSLVEIVVAMMVLSFGLLAMAASTGYVFNQLRSSSWDTQRNLVKQEVIEQMRGMFWDSIPAAARTQTMGHYTVIYSATQPFAAVKRVRIITRGPAYRGGATRIMTTDTTTVDVVRPI